MHRLVVATGFLQAREDVQYVLSADPSGLQGQLNGYQHRLQTVQGDRIEHLRHDPIATGVP